MCRERGGNNFESLVLAIDCSYASSGFVDGRRERECVTVKIAVRMNHLNVARMTRISRATSFRTTDRQKTEKTRERERERERDD